jgi:hypothetical protein
VEGREIRSLARTVLLAAESIILVPFDEVEEDRVNVCRVVVFGRTRKRRQGEQNQNDDRGSEAPRRNEIGGNEVGSAKNEEEVPSVAERNAVRIIPGRDVPGVRAEHRFDASGLLKERCRADKLD